MIIYRALFPNGKSYIGQTIYNLEKRKYEHKYSSEHGVKFVFYHAIRKYGFDSIEWSIIDTAETQEELNEKEKYWIKYYNTCIYNKNSNGYNSNFGGGSGSGYKHTKEAIEKIKLIHKGRKLSEESKEKIRKAHLGTKLSDEAKQKMSEVRKGEKHPLFGLDKSTLEPSYNYNRVSIQCQSKNWDTYLMFCMYQ
jgi:group I intron endonuclease